MTARKQPTMEELLSDAEDIGRQLRAMVDRLERFSAALSTVEGGERDAEDTHAEP